MGLRNNTKHNRHKYKDRENLYKPLKDLKGSSAWKGSEGCSLTLLLLNMAIFDLKESAWCWILKKSIWVKTNHVINMFTLQIDWTNMVIYGPPLYQGNPPGAFGATRSEKHENFLFVFMAPQWSQQVNKNKVIKGSTLKRKHSRSSHRTSESSIFLLRKVVP